jgi:hypothetical protein
MSSFGWGDPSSTALRSAPRPTATGSLIHAFSFALGSIQNCATPTNRQKARGFPTFATQASSEVARSGIPWKNPRNGNYPAFCWFCHNITLLCRASLCMPGIFSNESCIQKSFAPGKSRPSYFRRPIQQDYYDKNATEKRSRNTPDGRRRRRCRDVRGPGRDASPPMSQMWPMSPMSRCNCHQFIVKEEFIMKMHMKGNEEEPGTWA